MPAHLAMTPDSDYWPMGLANRWKVRPSRAQQAPQRMQWRSWGSTQLLPGLQIQLPTEGQYLRAGQLAERGVQSAHQAFVSRAESTRLSGQCTLESQLLRRECGGSLA